MPEPCRNYSDWLTNEQDHPAYHYWHWNAGDPRQSEQRLGQRIYIAACLLWTSLHDQSLATTFLREYPNWSAICSYYSMVHVWRLFWFVAYGSYPTGHSQMVSSLKSGRPGAEANWQSRELGRSQTAIAVEAFQGWLSERLSCPRLTEQLPLNGNAFAASKDLRTDSNYESLLLAHQYSHYVSGSVGAVDVKNEFSQTTRAMHAASIAATQFVVESIQAAFREECNWIGEESPYMPRSLYGLLVSFVQDKIKRYRIESVNASLAIQDWCSASESLSDDLQNVTAEQIGQAADLKKYIEYGLFGVKQDVMVGFQRKIRHLASCVDDLNPVE